MNALTDALGVRDIEMPATPQRIWRACQETKMKKLPRGVHVLIQLSESKTVADAAKVLAKDSDAKLLAGARA